MTPRYLYQPAPNGGRPRQWVHFLLFTAALLLLLAGLYELYLFLTDWSGAEGDHPYFYLIFAIVYLAVGALLVYAGVRGLRAAGRGGAHFVKIDDKTLSWSLNQGAGVEKIPLAEITSVERPNVRDLVLHLRAGGKAVLPIYLIPESAKQEELVAALG